ncbi:hypothetical protein VTN96DRAFT_5061 [Rasamsonia emersonii]
MDIRQPPVSASPSILAIGAASAGIIVSGKLHTHSLLAGTVLFVHNHRRVSLSSLPFFPNSIPFQHSVSTITSVMAAATPLPHHHRHNWAAKQYGVIVVFCIVFLVCTGIITLILHRKWTAKKAEKQAFTG